MVTLKFKIIQDPTGGPVIIKGTFDIKGSDVEDCWKQVQELARNICSDEFSIYLIQNDKVA